MVIVKTKEGWGPPVPTYLSIDKNGGLEREETNNTLI